MEKKVIKEEKIKNDNGSYTKIEKIETTPENGFVPEADIHRVDVDNYGEFHKGYSKSTVHTTNDPRITRPALKIMCGIFAVVGLFLLLIGIISFSFSNILFGILFVFFGSFGYIKGKKDIDKIEEELKQNDKEYINTDPKDVQKEFINNIKKSYNEDVKSTFTKEHFNWFLKFTLPIYCVISAIIFLLITIFVNVVLGIVILIILILCGLFYYWIVSKICKW